MYAVQDPMHPLCGALPVPYVPGRVIRGVWSHIGILMRLLSVEPRSTAGLLYSSQYLSGIILLALCSMVWDWLVSGASQCLFIGLDALSIFCRVLLPLSLLFFYGLVL